MAAPSRAWTIIPDGDVDSDSPVSTILMSAIQGNLIHLEEWLGKDYTAAQNHDHDGTNSALVAGGFLYGDDAVSAGTFATTSAVFVDVPGTTITIPAAQLPADRTVLVTAVFQLRATLGVTDPEAQLLIDGVARGGTRTEGGLVFVRQSYVESYLLFSGTAPVIKLQLRGIGGGGQSVEINKTHVVAKLAQ